VIATTFNNMAIGTAVLRDDGVLKRVAGTPPARLGLYQRADRSSTIVVTALMTGRGSYSAYAYGADVRTATLPPARGWRLARNVHRARHRIVRYVANAEAAPAVANAAILPLTFISGSGSTSQAATVLSDIGKVFPDPPARARHAVRVQPVHRAAPGSTPRTC